MSLMTTKNGQPHHQWRERMKGFGAVGCHFCSSCGPGIDRLSAHLHCTYSFSIAIAYEWGWGSNWL